MLLYRSYTFTFLIMSKNLAVKVIIFPVLYISDKSHYNLKEELRLKTFENKILKEKYRTKRELKGSSTIRNL